MGQKEDVKIYKITVKNTIEDRCVKPQALRLRTSLTCIFQTLQYPHAPRSKGRPGERMPRRRNAQGTPPSSSTTRRSLTLPERSQAGKLSMADMLFLFRGDA